LAGGIFNFEALDFGSVTRQHLNLWGAGQYGIGVQADTLYQRSLHGFAWFVEERTTMPPVILESVARWR